MMPESDAKEIVRDTAAGIKWNSQKVINEVLACFLLRLEEKLDGAILMLKGKD